MNEFKIFSQNQLHEYSVELSTFLESREIAELPFDTSQILFDEDVCEILKICPRTARSYRKAKLFRFMKIEGRVIYLKFYFYMDLLKIFHEQNNMR